MKNFAFSKYCTPAQLYLVIGVICIISGFFANYSIEMLLTKAMFVVIWAWVLNWLCSKGFKAISWILVLLPFIFFLFMYFLIKDVVVVKEGIFCDAVTAMKYGGVAACEAKNKEINDAIAASVAAAAADAKKRQEEAVAAAAAEQKRLADLAAAAAAEKKRQEEAAAAKCNRCLEKKTRSQCTPTYCKA